MSLSDSHIPHTLYYIPYLDPPNVPLLMAIWSLFDGIWDSFKGSWGVLVYHTELCFCGLWAPSLKPCSSRRKFGERDLDFRESDVKETEGTGGPSCLPKCSQDTYIYIYIYILYVHIYMCI